MYRAFFLFSLTITFMPVTNAIADMIDTKGMKPWEVCGLCHNLDGISHMAKFPKLAGQKAAYIEKQLKDFKAGRRQNDGGQMAAIVQEVNEKDIPAIASYFSRLSAPPAVQSSLSDEEKEAARMIFEKGDPNRDLPACVTCHIRKSNEQPDAPALYAQHADYIAKQLSDFRDQNRTNDPNGVMHNIAIKLTEQDIQSLAQYIAEQRR